MKLSFLFLVCSGTTSIFQTLLELTVMFYDVLLKRNLLLLIFSPVLVAFSFLRIFFFLNHLTLTYELYRHKKAILKGRQQGSLSKEPILQRRFLAVWCKTILFAPIYLIESTKYANDNTVWQAGTIHHPMMNGLRIHFSQWYWGSCQK